MLAQKVNDKHYLNLIILRNVKMFHTSTSQWTFFIELSYFVQHAVTLSLGCSNNNKKTDWEDTTLVIELTSFSEYFQKLTRWFLWGVDRIETASVSWNHFLSQRNYCSQCSFITFIVSLINFQIVKRWNFCLVEV